MISLGVLFAVFIACGFWCAFRPASGIHVFSLVVSALGMYKIFDDSIPDFNFFQWALATSVVGFLAGAQVGLWVKVDELSIELYPPWIATRLLPYEKSKPCENIQSFEFSEEVGAVVFSNSGELLAIVASDSECTIKSSETGSTICSVIHSFGAYVQSSMMAFGPADQIFAIANRHAVHVFEVGTGKLLQKFDISPRFVRSIQFPPVGKMLAVVSRDTECGEFSLGSVSDTLGVRRAANSVILLNCSDGSTYRVGRMKYAVEGVAFSPCGEFVGVIAGLVSERCEYALCSIESRRVVIRRKPPAWRGACLDHVTFLSGRSFEYPGSLPILVRDSLNVFHVFTALYRGGHLESFSIFPATPEWPFQERDTWLEGALALTTDSGTFRLFCLELRREIARFTCAAKIEAVSLGHRLIAVREGKNRISVCRMPNSSLE